MHTLILVLVIAQPQVPGTQPSVPTKNVAYDAYHRAIKTNRTLVWYVGFKVQADLPSYADAVEVPDYEGDTTPQIVVTVPDGRGGLVVDRRYWTAVRFAPEREVSRAAVPFAPAKVAASTADASPWLSSLETSEIRATWPKSLPWSETFYRLAPRYQFLTTTNNGRTKINTVTDIHDHEDITLTMSGGMVGVRGWTSWKRLDVPDGKRIRVWQEEAEVRAFAPVPRWRWEFPEGTVAWDALYHQGKPFEIRKATKRGTGWKSEVAFKDADAAPAGYVGVRQSCASCHDTTGQIMEVPERIYMRERWGSDSRFSWRPYDEHAQLDRRWPIELKE